MAYTSLAWRVFLQAPFSARLVEAQVEGLGYIDDFSA